MKAATSYKKQDGTLEYDEAQRNIIWSPAKGAGATKVPIATVTNLQQTPAASDKVALKVVAGTASYTFLFTSGGNACADQEEITAVLRNAITSVTTSTPALGTSTPGPQPNTNGDGPSPAMAIAQAVRSETDATNSWSDDRRLMSNVALQQSLFQKDPELRQRFEQSLRDKPESISHAQFGTQFWSSRLHLLRAHAIEQSQHQGAYNVLAQLKETNVDGARKLNLTKEHIQALFQQHPIIKLIYNENVPNKLTEAEFWKRFFVSKLLRKLKGENVHKDHPSDAILDKYLESDELSLRNKQLAEIRVPHFIDLEGNEQNQKWKGNRQDLTMIPEFQGKAPLHNVLNSMSGRMLANVQANDGPQHGPAGNLEATYDELRLNDLQTESSDDRVRLNISHQKLLFGDESEAKASEAGGQGPLQNPSRILEELRASIGHDPNDDMDSLERNEDASADDRAVKQVISLLTQQTALMSADSHSSNLAEDTLQSLHLTLNTTTEFLHYFWSVLQSVATGSSTTNKKDLASLNATLCKSGDRITAVAESAEKQRQAQISGLKRDAKEYFERTGKKRRIDESQITTGGKKEVETLLQPTTNALQFAQARYAAVVAE